MDKNVFVRKIPKTTTDAEGKEVEFTSSILHERFSQYGEIMSVKISLDKDHKSNGYGFVCFINPEDAAKAIKQTEKNDTC